MGLKAEINNLKHLRTKHRKDWASRAEEWQRQLQAEVRSRAELWHAGVLTPKSKGVTMAIDRKKLEEIFQRLGNSLHQPATLCVFGSSPGILLGQPARQTQDVDVWHTQSNYDDGDLARACSLIGVLYDPKEEVDPDAIYLQIVRPGIVALPSTFETETIARYGKLTVVMPAPVALSAAKLVRANENDVTDIVWWVRQRSITYNELEQSISRLPNRRHQETARENLVFVRLISDEKS